MKKRNLEALFTYNFIIGMFFFVGFILGMVLSFTTSSDDAQRNLPWLDSALMYLKHGEIYYGDMLFYVLKKRLPVVLIMTLLCFWKKGKLVLLTGVGVFGGFVGYFITEFILAKGILGSLLFLVILFPHYLCYVYGYYKALQLTNAASVKQYDINRVGQKEWADIGLNDREIIKKILPMAVVIIGILFECYVNSFFLKLFLKIFM